MDNPRRQDPQKVERGLNEAVSYSTVMHHQNILEEAKATREENDSLVLARLGKKQVLKRRFGLLSMVAFECIVLITWECTYFAVPSYVNGGSAGLVYGYLLVWLANLSVYTSLAELGSAAPTTGGPYHWVSMLAPRGCRRFLSYITGWMGLMAWQSGMAATAYITGTMVQGLLILNKDDYLPETWHGTLLTWACILVAVFINIVGSVILPFIEGTLFLVHVLGFVVVFIILCYLAPHGNAHDVLTNFYNGGGWPAEGLSFLIGLNGVAFAFLGADSAVHMAEEVHNASVNVPRSLIASVFSNGLAGAFILVATLLGVTDVEEALHSPSPYPYQDIFEQITGSAVGSVCMSSIIIFMTLASLVGQVATTSRLLWAFARDNSLPFSHFLRRVHPRTSIPANAVLVVTVVAALLSLINLGSSVVLNNIFSMAIIGFYSSYLAAIGLLLWRRVRVDIKLPHEVGDGDFSTSEIHPGNLCWGPWHVKGWWGAANNLFACAYLILLMFFSIWPPLVDPKPSEMNYSSVAAIAVVLWSVAYYQYSGKRKYRGPVVEIVL